MEQLELQFEQWKDIPGYGGKYQVSDYGRVRRIIGARKGMLNGYKRTNGYIKIALCSNPPGSVNRIEAHRLVMAAFVGVCPEGYCVNHINGNPSDNRLSNLEYITRGDNTRYSVFVLKTFPTGEQNHCHKLTTEQVLEMRRLVTEGHSYSSLSRQYGVSVNTVRRIAIRDKWKHI